VLGLPVKAASSSLILGGAVHEALACYHRQLQQHEATSSESVLEQFHDAWHERESSEEITYRDGDNREDCIAQGVQLLEKYLTEPPPERIMAVEQQFLVPIYNSQGEYLENPLVAITDLITTGEQENLVVKEFKTAGRAFSESEVQTSLQPTCYVHAVNEQYGKEATVEYVVLVKTKTPKVQRLTTTRYADDFGRLGDLIQTIEKAIDVGIFYPIENPMNCSTCSFRNQCRAWGSAGSKRSSLEPATEAAEELACSLS